jgi:hypothetical protein
LKVHLAALVDEMSLEKDPVSPLDIAVELLGGELEAFVLFGRMGHLDPLREDGRVAIAILRRMSEDPEIDERIRRTAQRWTFGQEPRS